MSYATEYIIHWTGAICLTLAAFAGICTMIWAGNHYGNQLAKQCIQRGGNWVVVNQTTDKWECHQK